MLIFIANQFIGNELSTGGDVLAVEMAKRVKGKLVILAPKIIHSEIKKAVGHGSLADTDNFRIGSETASSVLGGALTVFHYLIRSWSTTIWLLKNARENDTIYLTGDFICNSVPAWIIKKMKPKITILANFYHRNPSPEDRPGNIYFVSYFSRLLQGISLKIIRDIAHKVFVLSEVGKEELRREGLLPSKIVVSGAGINLKRQKIGSVEKKNQIVFIGRINVTKGAFDLIKIFSLVHQQDRALRLVMVGGASNSDLKKLNDSINRHKLSEVISYRGFVAEGEKTKILSESRALALPSKEEGFGIVVTEALSRGTPVVCYDLPALKMIFSKYKSVHYVKSFNQEKFAEKIIETVSSRTTSPAEHLPTWDEVYGIQSEYSRQSNENK